MIIYIHGFGSSGQGGKASQLREYCQQIGEPFLAPSLSYVPELAIQTLEELIQAFNGEVGLVGSSLGGFYTIYLSQKFGLKGVLINPAVNPQNTLQRVLGDAPNYYDESSFSWQSSHVEMLKQLQVTHEQPENLMLLLQKGDEVLDYREAQARFIQSPMVVEEAGDHSFMGFERFYTDIIDFLLPYRKYKHTAGVKGVALNNKTLANRVGDLYYDALADFLQSLETKLNEDAAADQRRGREKLSACLKAAAHQTGSAAREIEKAWKICLPFVEKWEKTHRSNR